MAYSVQGDIEKIFGANNVSAASGWADMDNDGDSDKIDARIAQAISAADEIIDGRMRATSYKLSLVTAANTTPTMVTLISAALAGVWLYDPRGAADLGDEGGMPNQLAYWKKWANEMLEEIASGRRPLDAVIGR